MLLQRIPMQRWHLHQSKPNLRPKPRLSLWGGRGPTVWWVQYYQKSSRWVFLRICKNVEKIQCLLNISLSPAGKIILIKCKPEEWIPEGGNAFRKSNPWELIFVGFKFCSLVSPNLSFAPEPALWREYEKTKKLKLCRKYLFEVVFLNA